MRDLNFFQEKEESNVTDIDLINCNKKNKNL